MMKEKEEIIEFNEVNECLTRNNKKWKSNT